MKILTPTFKKIARITLWSIVAALVIFIAFLTGGAFALLQIEQECLSYHVFEVLENVFECNIIHRGILS